MKGECLQFVDVGSVDDDVVVESSVEVGVVVGTSKKFTLKLSFMHFYLIFFYYFGSWKAFVFPSPNALWSSETWEKQNLERMFETQKSCWGSILPKKYLDSLRIPVSKNVFQY